MSHSQPVNSSKNSTTPTTDDLTKQIQILTSDTAFCCTDRWQDFFVCFFFQADVDDDKWKRSHSGTVTLTRRFLYDVYHSQERQ